MTDSIVLLQAGHTPRLSRLLDFALADTQVERADLQQLEAMALQGRRVLIALTTGAGGMSLEAFSLLQSLRTHPDCLRGAVGALLVDGDGELYTKQAAQAVALAANLAGCLFPGKPLVEGTGSLYNQHILARQLDLPWEETYFTRARELVGRLAQFTAPRFSRPRVLMLHASDNRRSNTVAMGKAVCGHLAPFCEIQTISLQNGAIYDCRGCSYTACLHYSRSGTCYYGGALPTEVFPAILQSDVVLLLCPNFNDSASANILALINRMTGLLLQKPLYDKYLYAIVVSGYSGGDLVARQILGALCLNKTMMLPPNFCLFQTANDPGARPVRSRRRGAHGGLGTGHPLHHLPAPRRMNGFTGVAVESAPFSLDRGHFNDKIRRVSPPILAICR